LPLVIGDVDYFYTVIRTLVELFDFSDNIITVTCHLAALGH